MEIVGFGKAAETHPALLKKMPAVARLRKHLEEGIQAIINNTRINGDQNNRLPNTSNLTFPGIRGESLVLELDKRGICLSAGSACHSGSAAPSSTLTAMGLTEEQAHCSVRFSIGYTNTIEEINRAIASLKDIIVESKKIIRFVSCR
jgi:cysteine sulfinate desulfinase/cysteine desulfurase-like protein